METQNMTSPQINELAAALAKAQSELVAAPKDAKNPFFKSSYSTLQSVWDACRLALTKNGLSVTQTTKITDKGPILVTTLMHTSGQWIIGEYPLRPVKDDPQAMGSAVSYARRYTLAAMVGVVSEEDDDAEKAMGREKSYVPKISEAQIAKMHQDNPPAFDSNEPFPSFDAQPPQDDAFPFGANGGDPQDNMTMKFKDIGEITFKEAWNKHRAKAINLSYFFKEKKDKGEKIYPKQIDFVNYGHKQGLVDVSL